MSPAKFDELIASLVAADTPVDWPKTLELLFSHPAFANRDQVITMTAAMPDSDGAPVWSGHFVDVPDGRWYVVLADGDTWRLSSTWSGATVLHLERASFIGWIATRPAAWRSPH